MASPRDASRIGARGLTCVSITRTAPTCIDALPFQAPEAPDHPGSPRWASQFAEAHPTLPVTTVSPKIARLLIGVTLRRGSLDPPDCEPDFVFCRRRGRLRRM